MKGGQPYKKRLMVTKSVRIPEDLLKRVEAQLWNKTLEAVPHGRQVEFYSRAVQRELEWLEGKNISIAIEALSDLYFEIGSCGRFNTTVLEHIHLTIEALKEYKQIKGEEIATI